MQFSTNLGTQADVNSFTRTALPLDEPARRYLSVVVAAIPANTAFPLHLHPVSEDLFVVVSGSGHLMESDRKRPLSRLDAVWVPPGHAHGLTSEREGVLEIGCQVPPDDTSADVAVPQHTLSPGHAIIAPVKSRTPTCGEPSWSSVFPASHRQRIRLMSAPLRAAQQLVAPSGPSAGAIIVVRGAGQIDGHILRTLAVAVYADESPPCVIARDDDTFLAAVLVFPDAVCNLNGRADR